LLDHGRYIGTNTCIAGLFAHSACGLRHQRTHGQLRLG
jgi:hypothetical protein